MGLGPGGQDVVDDAIKLAVEGIGGIDPKQIGPGWPGLPAELHSLDVGPVELVPTWNAARTARDTPTMLRLIRALNLDDPKSHLIRLGHFQEWISPRRLMGRRVQDRRLAKQKLPMRQHEQQPPAQLSPIGIRAARARLHRRAQQPVQSKDRNS